MSQTCVGLRLQHQHSVTTYIISSSQTRCNSNIIYIMMFVLHTLDTMRMLPPRLHAGTTIIDVSDAFCPGLLYVMLSRVTERRHIRLLQPLTPDMFTPMVVPGLE
jgi:hypothetical protein